MKAAACLALFFLTPVLTGLVMNLVWVSEEPSLMEDVGRFREMKVAAERMEGCEYLVEQSRMIRDQCQKLGLPYYETSLQREKVFDEILQTLTAQRMCYEDAEGERSSDP